MLTLKLINERTEWVIKGLEKKHFSGAKEAIENVLATDKKRREAQTQLDINLSESKKLAAQIGALMKQEKKEEAESIKTEVARLKDTNKALQEAMYTDQNLIWFRLRFRHIQISQSHIRIVFYHCFHFSDSKLSAIPSVT